ncbi:MAG TPA: mannose-1-phosphate guanylyltransferase, partial [Nitrospiraceae bacterium]|nr:mannose-1-phosphate guanylyltransferase [Nitrospiraceae bacterium]
MSAHLYAVILAGGSGTRFWPLSRHLYPKQLLRIMGDDTLIQQTMRRVLGCVEPDRVLISTNPAQAESIRVQLGEWKDRLEGNFVIEPEGRNTAPAIGLAALEVARRDPDGVMAILPADHVVKGEARFQAAVRLGAKLAEAGHLVTFGIKPIRPETGYGYIQPKRARRLGKEGRLAGYPVARFVEKPDARTAARYLKAGAFYWNSGMFVWKAATILKEIEKHQPALGRGLGRIKQLLDAGASRSDIDGLYRELPSVSIDTGVMERSAHAAMIPVDFQWSDVGNWSSIEEVAPQDQAGNVINGKVVDLDSHN